MHAKLPMPWKWLSKEGKLAQKKGKREREKEREREREDEATVGQRKKWLNVLCIKEAVLDELNYS